MSIISYDLGGTFTKWGIFENDELIRYGKFSSHASYGGEALMQTLEKHLMGMMHQYQITGIAISSAGTIDHINGTVVQASDTIPNYKGMNIKKILKEILDVPIYVENDVTCAMYAETKYGHGIEQPVVFGITIGTGVGASLIYNGEIYHGSSNFAGEIGYIEIDHQPLDLSGSTRGLCQRIAILKNEEPYLWDGIKVFEAYQKNDKICIQEVKRMCKNISKILAIAICMYNTNMIIIGGGIMEQKKILLPIIIEELTQRLPKHIVEQTKINEVKLGNLAGIYGAYALFKGSFL